MIWMKKIGFMALFSTLILFSGCSETEKTPSEAFNTDTLPSHSSALSAAEETDSLPNEQVESEASKDESEAIQEKSGFLSLPTDTGTLAPINMLQNALRLTQSEVEETLGLAFSEDNINFRTGGYLLDCQVDFGDMTATQVDLGFGKVNQEDENKLLLSVAYQFSFDTAQEGWEAFQTAVEEARSQGAISTMEEYYGQESGFIRYGTFEDFDAGAREAMGKSGLPTVECLERFYVDDRTICEYSFVYAPEEEGYIASVGYSAEIVRTINQGNQMK